MHYLKSRLVILLLEIIVVLTSTIDQQQNNNIEEEEEIQLQEDAIIPVPDLITKYGYPVQVHQVETEDGYILTLHRIRRVKDKRTSVVLVQHGLISNSAETLLAGPNNSLSYLLADLNYDVWLGNTRGNRYSTKHKYLNVNSKKFWDFTWSEMGYYDLPAMIDYILQETREEKLFYIGHSRGTLVFYVMCAERPEYNEKIRAMISLAPVAYMSHIPSTILRNLAAFTQPIYDYFKLMNIFRIRINRKRLSYLGQKYCNEKVVEQNNYCGEIFFALGGFDSKFNLTLLPIILGHFPDCVSVKELLHFGQIITSGKLSKLNYGSTVENVRRYNRTNPPDYDLSKVSAPVVMFYSNGDLQSSHFDVEQLYRELGNPVAKYLIPEIHTHFYFFLNNMTQILYNRILSVIKQF